MYRGMHEMLNKPNTADYEEIVKVIADSLPDLPVNKLKTLVSRIQRRERSIKFLTARDEAHKAHKAKGAARV